MRIMWTLLASLVVVFVMACAPKPIGPPASTPTPPTTPVALPSSPTTPALSADDEAWAKVVQAAKKEGRVVNYTYSFVGDVAIAMDRAFKEKYGITIETVAASSTVAVERLKTEHRVGQTAADLMDGSIRGTKLAVDEGFSARVTDLPFFKEKGDIWVVPPNAWDPQDRNLITHLTYLPYFVNTKLVPPSEEPKSWYDLLDPKWKGQIVIADPRISTSMDSWNVTFVMRGGLEKDYPQRLAMQQLQFSSAGARGPAEVATRGEAKIALTSDDSALQMIRQGAPLKAISPKEGTYGSAQGITLISKGPHPNAARVFVNWLFSEEGATIYAKARNGASIRKGVPNFQPEAVRISQDKIYVQLPEEADVIIANFQKQVMYKILAPSK